jgi:hypothetical protein
MLLAIHAIVGFAVAKSSAPAIVSGTLDDRTFALSFAIVASGLLAASFAFRLSRPSKCWSPKVNLEKLITISKVMTIAAVVVIFWFYRKNHLLPWDVDILKIGELRYGIAGLDEWLINRSTDVLTLTIPLLFLFGGWSRIVSLIGFVGLAITFKRAPILAVILVAVLASVLRSGRQAILIVVLGAILCIYATSQIFYFGLLSGDFASDEAYLSVASGLPEVRDLGWLLWLNKSQLQWGTTFVQPILPIPSFMSPWIQQHSLRAFSSKMIGYDWEEMGGLRITLAGEGYLNFGPIGALALGGIWGWGMRKVSGFSSHAARSGSVIDAYLAALLVSWMAFWIYLGGSQASGSVRTASGIMLLSLYASRITYGRLSVGLNRGLP